MKNLLYRGEEAGHSTLKVRLLAVFAGGPIVYGVQRVDGALLFAHLSTKTWQKWTRGNKVAAPPRQVGGVVFTENSQWNSA
jgi:hypothetical protein